MFAPEFLYQLTPRDQQVTWLDPRFAAASSAPLAASVTVGLLTVPEDKVFIMQFAAMNAAPGAGQNSTQLSLAVTDPAGANVVRFRDNRVVLAAAVASSLDWSGSLIIPPTWNVVAIAQFNAGAVANTVTGWCGGMLIPRGNVQRL